MHILYYLMTLVGVMILVNSLLYFCYFHAFGLVIYLGLKYICYFIFCVLSFKLVTWCLIYGIKFQMLIKLVNFCRLLFLLGGIWRHVRSYNFELLSMLSKVFRIWTRWRKDYIGFRKELVLSICFNLFINNFGTIESFMLFDFLKWLFLTCY